MTDKEVQELKKQVSEYRQYCLSDKYNPFGQQDAFWAVGFENFLSWLKRNDR